VCGGYNDEGGLGQCCDPVFVPEEVEDFRVESGFEVGDVEGVVLICMDAKVFYFIEWDGLVFGGFGVRGDIFLRIRSECSDIHFSTRHRSMGINLQRVSPNNLNDRVGGEGGRTTTATHGS